MGEIDKLKLTRVGCIITFVMAPVCGILSSKIAGEVLKTGEPIVVQGDALFINGISALDVQRSINLDLLNLKPEEQVQSVSPTSEFAVIVDHSSVNYYLVNLKNGEKEELPTGSYNDISWSPDGTFFTYAEAVQLNKINTQNPNEAEVLIEIAPGEELITKHFWTTNEDVILLSQDGKRLSLYDTETKTQEPIRVNGDYFISNILGINADRELVFRGREGIMQFGIYELDRGNGDVSVLIDKSIEEGLSVSRSSLSPDGRFIIYEGSSQSSGGISFVEIIDTQTNQRQRINDTQLSDTILWLPDKVVFGNSNHDFINIDLPQPTSP